MDQPLFYDLAFVPPNRRPRTAPEIIFIIDEQYLPVAIDRLQMVNEICADYVGAYLRDDDAHFRLPTPDLFGNREFGYRNCGYCTIEDGKVHFRLQLRPPPWRYYCTMSIWIFTNVFGAPLEGDHQNSRMQDAVLLTRSELRSEGDGHAVGGWVSGNVLSWLRGYAEGRLQNRIIEAAPMHPEVI